jgi:D-alanyl-D-alanine carboxypeptidase/D-alanyl-D-alanine-endopeptidase (penicillin-binding protein 4)
MPRIAQLASPPLGELIDRVNKHSNNFMAEQIALATGAQVFGPPGNWEKTGRAFERFLTEVGLPAGSYQIRNASGLHDVNRMTARQLVAVLSYMHHHPRLAPEFLASMSVAGAAGTLSNRMQDTDAAGVLRAKTGTLSVASALSGFVTAKRGEVLAFSLIVNNFAAPVADVWAAQDEIGAVLAAWDTHCGPLGASPAVSSALVGAPQAVEVALP